ncbi:FkbM family methyltransferase [Pseudomonas protegens]|uniref:FkbM family methyltransferase n=1 Tax=Pseudomonas protegens TaxID=380021 RepID=UPI002024B04A|nr:FkbM family methyltransferase [Pseudomonas protegens]MCL9657979.1 FkbM family methyltransferase [Pseudomonas protegens]
MNNIIVDLGANHGGFSLDAAKRNPNIIVHAIEPYSKLAKELHEQAHQIDLNNHIVHEVGIAETKGRCALNISTGADHGASSILSFAKSHLHEDEYWSTRLDLVQSDQVEILTLPLSSFLDTIKFDRISFIKIDIQGMDLVALKTAGEYLNKIDAGMLEVSAVERTSLYEGPACDLLSALIFFNENGFYVYNVKPNDPASNEFNIFFCRRGINYKEIEARLSLTGMKYYDGKHYWHFPSNRQEYPEHQIITLTDLLRQSESKITDIESELESTKKSLSNFKLSLAYKLHNLLSKW